MSVQRYFVLCLVFPVCCPWVATLSGEIAHGLLMIHLDRKYLMVHSSHFVIQRQTPISPSPISPYRPHCPFYLERLNHGIRKWSSGAILMELLTRGRMSRRIKRSRKNGSTHLRLDCQWRQI